MRIKLSDIGNPRVNLLRIAAKAFLDGIGFWFTGGPSPRVRACPTWQIARDALGQTSSLYLHKVARSSSSDVKNIWEICVCASTVDF